MSCSICLLPFVPATTSMFPRPPPKGILTPQQEVYFRTAIGIGHRVMGTIARFDYLDNNMFGSVGMLFMEWESYNGTFFMLHTACASILRHVIGAENTADMESLIRLCEIEEVLGRPQGGENACRLPFVPYEDIGHYKDRVDIRPFWQIGDRPGLNLFSWKLFSESPGQWAMSKPDIFPRFFPQVNSDRLSFLGTPVAQPGILASQPLDVMLLLLPYLPLPAFLALTSTCRLIRLHALTTFQPCARALVLSLGWAVPLLGVGEYDAAISKTPKAAVSLVHPTDSPRTGDWLLYLSHVHRTSSMRSRRRIWNICETIQRVVEEQLPSSEYGKNIDVEREKLEANLAIMGQAMNRLSVLNAEDNLASQSGMPTTFVPPAGWPSIPMGDFPLPPGALSDLGL